MLIPDCPSIIKLSGTWIGAAIANIGSSTVPMVAALPLWAEDFGKWGGIVAVFAGVFTTIGIGVGQWLKNIRTVQEIKVQQRKDLHDIQRAKEDAVCMRRRICHECPLLAQGYTAPDHQLEATKDDDHGN